jgi:hypothetical protein
MCDSSSGEDGGSRGEIPGDVTATIIAALSSSWNGTPQIARVVCLSEPGT